MLGGLVIPCGCGASYLGGHLIKHYRMRPPAILKISMLWVTLSFIFSLAFMVNQQIYSFHPADRNVLIFSKQVYCPNHDFAGVTTPYR